MGNEEFYFSDRAKKALTLIKEVLELNSIKAVWPVIIATFKSIMVHFRRNEKFRLIALVNPDTKEYVAIADIEELRVKGKQIEFSSEKNDGGEDS